MVEAGGVFAAPGGFGGVEAFFLQVGEDVVGGGEEKIGPGLVLGREEVEGLFFEEAVEGGLVAETRVAEIWMPVGDVGEEGIEGAGGDVAAEGADEGVAGGIGARSAARLSRLAVVSPVRVLTRSFCQRSR